ncbi:MAG: sulfatase-like hydrolase/transferase [Acidobacteriota bacterium]
MRSTYLLPALAAAAACTAPRPSPPTHVLLVTIDTLRADRVGCYGYAAAHTPNLDALCGDGVVFENAFAPAPLTLPAHATMLTGLHPAAHGLYANASGRLGEGVRTLAEAVRSRVRHSGAVLASVVLDARFGLDRGFDDYDDRMPPAPAGRYLFQRERRAEAVASAAISWIQEHAGEPFFLWVHFYDPHAPYDPPARWRGHPADPYDGEIAAVDEALGRLLDTLADLVILDETLVVIAGDHGEDLGQHGEATHGVFLYDSTLRVPLVFRFPRGLPRGKRVPGVVRLVDLAPTLLDLWDLPVDEDMQGQSLLPLLSGARRDPGLEAFCESRLPEIQYGWAPLAALRTRDWLYVRAPEEELYDLRQDPAQLENVASEKAAHLGDLRRRLEAIERSVRKSREAPRVELSEEMKRQLESLGYVGSSPRAAETGGKRRDDPKRRVRILELLNQAGELVASGRAARARVVLEEVLATDAENPYAMRLQARSLVMLGRDEEARLAYEKLAALAGEDAEILNALGAIHLRRGRLGEAEQRFRAALELSPRDARARNNLAFILARSGQIDEALRLLEAVLEDDPAFLDAALNLALLHQELGNLEEAERRLRQAHEQAAAEPAIAQALVQLLLKMSRPGDARGVLSSALQANPEASALRLLLAQVLERLGEPLEARRMYRRVLSSGRATEAQRRAAQQALGRLAPGA